MISVLMSVYAKERPEHLRAALGSLAGQSFLADQVVIVFDGALTDELEAVVVSYLELLPLCIVRLPVNVGLACALNAGLERCRNDWVARFDSDDICDPSRFMVQAAFLQENPQIDVLGSWIAEFELEPSRPHAIRKVPKNHEDIVAYARTRCPFNHMSVIFRRSAVIEVGGYPGDVLYEDYSLWVNLILNGCRLGNLDALLVRARAGSAMIGRRGGWGYFVSEYKAQRRFLRTGFISAPQFIFNVVIRGVARLAPDVLRRYFYSMLLRGRVSSFLISDDAQL